MPSQGEIWQAEHETQKTFTRIHSLEPSGPIPGFVKLMIERGIVPEGSEIVDIGSGKGRNSIYLANLGYKVRAFDFARDAIEAARERSATKDVEIEAEVVDLTKTWPIADEKVSGIIDCNTTICIANPGRDFAVQEARRVLKKGGLYLFYGVARTAFVDTSPGSEPNSAIFPRTGKFEKQYTNEELLQTYKEFEVVSLERIEGSDIIEGEETKYSMWVAVFEKEN